jgi:formylglycine-generating enzyme required for sulfatase activity
MIIQHVMNAAGRLVYIVAVIAFLPATESKLVQSAKAVTPSTPDPSDRFIGKEDGQVRDDNGLKLKLVWCPPGNFRMGSPRTEVTGRYRIHPSNEIQEKVTLTRGFWFGKYEVTQAQWKGVMGTEPWKGQIFTKEGADLPATWVSWDDAMDFCRKLTDQERRAGRLLNDWEYTLPTEAQWEYACRARTKTRFSFGHDVSKLGAYAWFDGNATVAGEPYAHQVGQKKANPWGLYDMHGNVGEWCRDVYSNTLPGGRDPESKPDSKNKGPQRASRGGNWADSDFVSYCRSASRNSFMPGSRNHAQGFRFALSSAQ